MEVCRNARCTFFFIHYYTTRFIFFKLRYFEDFFDLYAFATSKYSYCKLIKPSNQPIHTFFSHFCTHLFYIEGNGKEGKVHEDLVLSKMAETFVIHIVFHLSEHGFRFYASLSSVFQPFLGAELLFGFLPVFSEPVIQFYRPVSFCFKTAASQGTAFTPDSSVPCIFADISGCGFHMSGSYSLKVCQNAPLLSFTHKAPACESRGFVHN